MNTSPVHFEIFTETTKGGLFKKPVTTTKFKVVCSEHPGETIYENQAEANQDFWNHARKHPHFHVSVAQDKKAGTTLEESPFVDFDSARLRAQEVASKLFGSKVVYVGIQLSTGMDIYQVQLQQGKITTLVTACGCLGCS